MQPSKIRILTNVGKSLGASGTKLLQQLEKDGFEIASAADVKRFVREATENPPDLFLLNPQKTRMDGVKIFNLLQSTGNLKDIPVVFLAGKAGQQEVAEALDLGIADYITGPFGKMEIAARLKQRTNKAPPVSKAENNRLKELEETLDSLPSLLFVTDSEGNIYDYHLPSPPFLFGAFPKKQPKNISGLLPQNTALVLLDTIGQSERSGQSISASCLIDTPRGVGSIEFLVSPRGRKNTSRYVVLVNDITERKQFEKERFNIEQELRRAEKMEIIGRLAGGVGHDMNNILGVVMGLASSLRTQRDIPFNLAQDIEQIITACRRGYELTSKLANLTNDVSFNKERLSLNSVVDDARELVSRAISDRIKIQTNLDPHCLDFIGDAIVMNHVLINLALNAADAMPAGGTLTFTTENYLPGSIGTNPIELEPGRYVVLRISDTGHGMTKEVLDRAFEPFFSTRKDDLTAGLGLPMVYGIIKNHGGRITLQSEEGKGTKVNILLPAYFDEDELAEGDEDARKSVPPETRKCLVVDDDEMVVFALRRLLQGLGYSVIPAHSGAQALEIFEQQRDKIAFVLLDLIMPYMDGADVFEKMKKIDKDVPVILCTGRQDSKKAQDLLNKGVVAVLQKPFDLNQLSSELDKLP